MFNTVRPHCPVLWGDFIRQPFDEERRRCQQRHWDAIAAERARVSLDSLQGVQREKGPAAVEGKNELSHKTGWAIVITRAKVLAANKMNGGIGMRKITSYKVLAVICDEPWGGSLQPGIMGCDLDIQDESWKRAAMRAVAQALQIEIQKCHLSNHCACARQGWIEGATNYPKVCCQDGLFEVALRCIAEYVPITLVSDAATKINGKKYNQSFQVPYDPSEDKMNHSIKQAVEQDIRSRLNVRYSVVGIAYSNGYYAVSLKHDNDPDVFCTILFRNADYEEGVDD